MMYSSRVLRRGRVVGNHRLGPSYYLVKHKGNGGSSPIQTAKTGATTTVRSTVALGCTNQCVFDADTAEQIR